MNKIKLIKKGKNALIVKSSVNRANYVIRIDCVLRS